MYTSGTSSDKPTFQFLSEPLPIALRKAEP